MTKASKKVRALGGFLIACGRLDNGVRGGKQKLQKIIGKKYIYQQGKKWFYNIAALKKLTATQLDRLTAKVKAAK